MMRVFWYKILFITIANNGKSIRYNLIRNKYNIGGGTMKVIEMFAGIGSQAKALERISKEPM